MNRRGAIAAAALLVAVLVGIGLLKKPGKPSPASDPPPATVSKSYPPLPPGPTIGEEVLADYADPAKPPRHDLQLVGRLVHSYRALVKTHTAKPIGCNADLTEALLGRNPTKQVFLPPDFAHLTEGRDAELLDRWRTPLIVHPLSSDRYELRSAGPDKRPYTEDDVLLSP